MATIDRTGAGARRYRVGLIVLAVLAVAGVVAWNWREPPQMGADEGVFRTVDALFTAVTGRDERRLGDCEQRLKGYRDAGKLPPDAADALDAIIRQARSGRWESAAERLYAFMMVQRREGAVDHAPKAVKAAKAKGSPKGRS